PWPALASEAEATALAQRGVTSPTTLRLALYDFAQATAGGYLPAAERERRLDEFAASLGIARATVEALLASASQVEWRVTPEAARGSGGGLGAVVKRVCFLARSMGVNYEVAF